MASIHSYLLLSEAAFGCGMQMLIVPYSSLFRLITDKDNKNILALLSQKTTPLLASLRIRS